MPTIRACPLPDGALLARYNKGGSYTDCYCLDIPGTVSQSQYVRAFYTTWVFKLERMILRWAVSRPSTDAEAAQLAEGSVDRFAAWRVEDRSEQQLLLGDFSGRTKSWLMAVPSTVGAAPVTRLYFGSAVTPAGDARAGKSSLGPVFSALLGFHKIYSVVLLRAAAARLLRDGGAQHL